MVGEEMVTDRVVDSDQIKYGNGTYNRVISDAVLYLFSCKNIHLWYHSRTAHRVAVCRAKYILLFHTFLDQYWWRGVLAPLPMPGQVLTLLAIVCGNPYYPILISIIYGPTSI